MVILLSYTGTSHTGSHLILTTDDSSLRGYSYPCSWKKWGSERLSKWPKETQHGQHPGSPGFQTPCSFLCCGFDSAIVFAMSSPAGVECTRQTEKNGNLNKQKIITTTKTEVLKSLTTKVDWRLSLTSFKSKHYTQYCKTLPNSKPQENVSKSPPKNTKIEKKTHLEINSKV